MPQQILKISFWLKLPFFFALVGPLFCLMACQSSVLSKAEPNPYPLKTWARCRSITGPATEVDFYLWNRSTATLSIDLAALFANKSLAPMNEITINEKSTSGIQSFRHWKSSGHSAQESLFVLPPNDAVDIEFDTYAVEEDPFEIRVNFSDPQKISYQVKIPCRN